MQSTGLEILEAFVLNGKSHTITTIWEGTKPLFKARDVAILLGLYNVHSSLETFDEDEKAIRITEYTHSSQPTAFLTEVGLYRLLMQSRKPIARTFQKWVVRVIQSIRETGMYKLEQELDASSKRVSQLQDDLNASSRRIADLLHIQARLTADAADAARHKALLDMCGEGECVVYMGKIRQQDDGKVLVKIGSTHDMSLRYPDLVDTFGSMQLFEVFRVTMHTQFENFLLHHRYIEPLKYTEPIHDGHRSREVFLMDAHQVTRVVNVAKRNCKRYNVIIPPENVVDIDEKPDPIDDAPIASVDAPSDDNDHVVSAQELPQKPEPVVTRVMIPYYSLSDDRRYTQSRGNKIQRYSPDGKTLIKTYLGCAEASRDKDLPAPVANLIRDASKAKTLYKGFRWAQLDRALPDDTMQDIGKTVESQTTRKGFVAMLNLDQDAIVRVFMDMKDAADNRQFKGCAAISAAIAKGTRSGGHHFKMWHDCSDSLKEAYLRDNDLPKERVRANAAPIEQLDSITKETIKVYTSLANVQREMRMARATMKHALATGEVVKGFLWRYTPQNIDE